MHDQYSMVSLLLAKPGNRIYTIYIYPAALAVYLEVENVIIDGARHAAKGLRLTHCEL